MTLRCMSRTRARENLHSTVVNVKGLFAQYRRGIWSLNDSNGIRTDNHFVRKRTFNDLAKLLQTFELRTSGEDDWRKKKTI